MAVTHDRISNVVGGVMDEGIGTVTFDKGRLVVDFPYLRRSWPRHGSQRAKYVVGRIGEKVFLVQEMQISALKEILRRGLHPADAEIHLRFRSGGQLDFDQPMQFLSELGWEDWRDK